MPDDPAVPPTTQQQPTQTFFTQEQVNSFNAAAKREAVGTYLKEAGLDNLTPQQLKELADKAAEHDKANATVQTERDQFKAQADQLPTLQAQYRRAELAAEVKGEGDRPLPPHLWKYVEGNSDEEINASIAKIKQDFNLAPPTGNQQQQPPGTPGATPGVQPLPSQGFNTGNGGQQPPKTIQSGRDAYKARHGQQEQK